MDLGPGGVLSCSPSFVMEVPLEMTLPKHGTVILPTFFEAGVTCGGGRNVEMVLDLEKLRTDDVADSLSRVDAYATKTSMLSLLRPDVARDDGGSGGSGERCGRGGRKQREGLFRFTRLVSPLSAIDVAFKHERDACYNDWHPITLLVTMVEGGISADGLELTMWLTSRGSGERPFEIKIQNQQTKEYELYDPQIKGTFLYT